MGIFRLLLALSVLVTHMRGQGLLNGSFALLDGSQAVCLFFIISGYYMGMVLTEKYRPDAGGTKAFYKNRFLRLYPSYAVVLLATIGWYLACVWYTGNQTTAYPVEICRKGGLFAASAVCFSNLSMIGLDLLSLFQYFPDGHYEFVLPIIHGTLAPGAEPLGNARWIGQAWSIGAEFWFYLLAPFLVRKATWKIILVALISLGLHCALVGIWHRNTYMLWPAHFWQFLLGVLFYRLTSLPVTKRLAARLPVAVCAITVSVCIVALAPLTGHPLSIRILYLFMIPLVPLLFHSTKRISADRYCGNLSYPVYVSHQLILNIVAAVRDPFPMSDLPTLAVAVAATLAVSIALVQWVEIPIERWRELVARKGGKALPQPVSPSQLEPATHSRAAKASPFLTVSHE